MKIKSDKYYTDPIIAKHCIDKTFEVIGRDNITDIVEPSAGNGSFSHQVACTAIDIEPEGIGILQQDFLTWDIQYKKGRLIIGNPPFGERNNLARKFYLKAAHIGDYIAFILPISQYNNTQSLNKFGLVYSEDLGIADYSGRKLHCCLNVYKRGEKPYKKLKLTDIDIIRKDRKGYDTTPFDIRMCCWGNGSAGKILKDGEKYAAEYKIKINNEALRNRIIDFFNKVNWFENKPMISMMRISQQEIFNKLKEAIPEIK